MSQQEAADPPAAGAEERPGGLPRSGSASRLNAQAPEFVPRAAAAAPPPPPPAQTVVRLFPPPPRSAAFFVAGPPPPPPFGYYAAVGAGGAGFRAAAAAEQPVEAEQPAQAQQPARDEIFDDAVHKIIKQVEYYFSDINLATTEHLMRFITRDPEGYVPISVVASFKKIKALVPSNSMLASALRTSSKLVISDDGTRVKRERPFTESDLEELQARIVVAENLPDDHSYPNLMRLFSAVGSVRTIRTCYPQTPNGTGPVTNRSSKLDMLFANKLHAFVEYDTIEDATKAIVELNDERNWRSGLRVRLLNTCMTKGGRGKKGGPEADGYGDEENVSTSYQPNDKHLEETSQLSDAHGEHVTEDGTGDMGRGHGRGRGRGGRGRGRGYHHHNNNQHHNNHHQQQHQNSNHHGNSRSGAIPVVTTPSGHPMKIEQQQEQQAQPQPQALTAANKQPTGPRMPDGTRGFTMGRGKPQTSPSVSASEPEP
ncbi:la-related protein 6B-like isoform X2 [Phragmites australis]|uniref:la-related protein 6B-like isoform X2 n=1 Tax=Phragmites australis TaxID=29695 RepID=UPI002D795AEF|nr:la-related protein 6B-like isoform X2 [Phragmites australis]